MAAAPSDTGLAESAPSSLRVTRIEVEGLFEQFDHIIPLNQKERVTVLHGPNGVGKTKVLEMTKAALTATGDAFVHVPFRFFDLHFSDGQLVRVFLNEKGEPVSEVVVKLPCRLVETQRLLRIKKEIFNQTAVSLRVAEVATGLAQIFEQVMAEYGRDSQALDRSYPQRVIAKGKGPILAADALKARLEALGKLQTDFQALGILDPGDVAPPDLSSLESLDATERRAMTLYVVDTEQKLSVLRGFAEKLQLFLRVTPQFLRKRLRFDRKVGLVVENDAGKPLPLDVLSSGEQHQLVLNYELLFATQPNTLVLIDEPELSLHVSWQKKFLPNMIDVARVAQIDIVVGTHSPFIIGDRADLMVALGGEAV